MDALHGRVSERINAMAKLRVMRYNPKTGKSSGPLMPVTHQPEPKVKKRSIYDVLRKMRKKKGYGYK